MTRSREPICPHCNKRTQCVTGKRIYPHRPDLFAKRFWLCQSCGAYCGCHPNSKRPLGSPANEETRAARSKAHSMFDPLWKSRRFTRSQAYHWLCEQTGIPREQCHIGMMNVEQCALVVEAVQKLRRCHVPRSGPDDDMPDYDEDYRSNIGDELEYGFGDL